MPATNKYKRVKLAEITVAEERQRKNIDTSDLEPSIAKHGVIQPIIIDQERNLIAGERRYRASQALGLPDIPCRFFEDLSITEAKIIELEENLKRKDLDWRDETLAIHQIHELYSEAEEDWSQVKTAEALSMARKLLNTYLRVAQDLDNPRIKLAGGVRPAYNILRRLDDRKISDAMSDIIEAGSGIFDTMKSKAPKPPRTEGEAEVEDEDEDFDLPSEPEVPEESLLLASFLEWAPIYEGRKCNFIHCDFPYGVNVFGGNFGGRRSWKTYEDKHEDIYWDLLRCLCDNLDRIATESMHIMFWLPADPERQVATLEMFADLAPDVEFWGTPLVWHKTDNVGIMQDPRRGPRHIYETAIFGYRDDRQVVKPVSDVYDAPTDKRFHPSTKPEPMLRHFFQMFVDETTRLLDPTCGGGSALRAAESLGAKQVLGLEMEQEYYDAARSALRSFRTLRGVSK